MISDVSFKLDWFAVTVFAPVEQAFILWDIWFRDFLGDPAISGFGGRLYQVRYDCQAGAKIYTEPHNDGVHFHFEFTGQAVDCVPRSVFMEFMRDLEHRKNEIGRRFNVTRIDLAWDNPGFTPDDMEQVVINDDLRTLAKRGKWNINNNPHGLREDGKLGTKTVYVGSTSSSRLVRVYNLHGPTRIEFMARSKRAHAVALSVLCEDVEHWPFLAMAHLRDFMDVVDRSSGAPVGDCPMLPWWADFVGSVPRFMMTVSNGSAVTLDKLNGWMVRQVSAAFSILHDLYGDDFIETLDHEGLKRRCRSGRYDKLEKYKMVQSRLLLLEVSS